MLGAGLIRALRARIPDAVFEGVAGPRMIAAGCRAWHPMERLSVMGLVEVLGRYRELRALRADVLGRLRADPPDVFVGIDAPDFNLGLETRLKAAGIPTVHYVSPTVWAWRARRLRKIARADDLVLTLFPFETAIYERHGIAARCVGHPLADAIPPGGGDRMAARAALGLPAAGRLIALLPGSREGEVRRLSELFVAAARWCRERRPELRFAAPLVSPELRDIFTAALAAAPELPVTLFEGRAREVMAAADAVLLASGTATLEAMLLQRPMVVAYRLAPLTYWLARRLLYIDRFALPNLLAGEDLVPEFIQDAATPAAIGAALLESLDAAEQSGRLRGRFAELHAMLRRDADAQAAEAVLALIAGRRAGAGA